MMTLHDFIVQLLLILSPAAILVLIEIAARPAVQSRASVSFELQ